MQGVGAEGKEGARKALQVGPVGPDEPGFWPFQCAEVMRWHRVCFWWQVSQGFLSLLY